jgi:hypothetical protein
MNMIKHINSYPNQFDTGIVPIQNLLRTAENRVRHPQRTERNYDWNIRFLLFRLLAGGRHYLVYTPKQTTYNSLIYDKKNKIWKKGKYENYNIATGDFDNNPDIPDYVILLDELNRYRIQRIHNRGKNRSKIFFSIFSNSICPFF